MELIGKLRGQRGDSTATNIMVIVLLAVIVLLIWRVGVPVFRKMLLDQSIEKFVNWDRENQRDPADQESILHVLTTQAKRYGFEAKRELIIINYMPDERILKIKMHYEVPIDLFIFRIMWKQDVEKQTSAM